MLAWLLEARNRHYHRRIVRRHSDIDVTSRIRAHEFVGEFLHTCRQPDCSPPPSSSTGHSLATGEKSKFHIWIYWAQGFRNAPPVVAACRRRLYDMNKDAQIIELDDSNIASYVDIPSYVYEKIGSNKTHFSDVLRCALLAEYGGIWSDATCYCAKPLGPLIQENSGRFFAYTRTDAYLLSSWFMIAAPFCRVPVLLRDALYTYWLKSDRLENYYWIHYLFEALYNQDPEFKAAWDCRTIESSAAAHTLQGELSQPFVAQRFNEILELTSIQKLTYKIPDPPSGSYWHHVCESVY
jgi:hypothetical protein